MALTKRLQTSEPPVRDSATETVVWIMIGIVLAMSCFATAILWYRAGGY